MKQLISILSKKWAFLLAVAIISLGIVFRLVEFVHCRDLMLDEVNVARNLYTDNITDTFKPQNYGTFAPPFFLLITKLIALLLGYGERALRLYPTIAGCLGLLLFYQLLKAVKIKSGFWLPLALLAFVRIYLLYTNDVKQYVPDMLITILLLWLFTKFSLNKGKSSHFFWLWSVVGGLAIWFSMPSIFILAAIALGYCIEVVEKRDYKSIYVLIGTGLVWLLSFLIYYEVLLKDQIASDYLQNWHEHYFLKLDIWTKEALLHNQSLLNTVFTEATGIQNYGLKLVLIFLMILGIANWCYKQRWQYVAITCLPILLLLIASGMRHFTMLSRVCMFSMPLLLILIGNGLETILINTKKSTTLLASLLAVVLIVVAGEWGVFKNRIEVDELTRSIRFAKANGVANNNMYLYELYEPNLFYYQNIQPDSEKRALCNNIRILYVGGRYEFDSVGKNVIGRSAFIYFWIDDNTLQSQRDLIFSQLAPVDSLKKDSYFCLVFDNKDAN